MRYKPSLETLGVVEKRVVKHSTAGQEQASCKAVRVKLQLHARFTRETRHSSGLSSHLTSHSLTRRVSIIPLFDMCTIIQ